MELIKWCLTSYTFTLQRYKFIYTLVLIGDCILVTLLNARLPKKIKKNPKTNIQNKTKNRWQSFLVHINLCRNENNSNGRFWSLLQEVIKTQLPYKVTQLIKSNFVKWEV